MSSIHSPDIWMIVFTISTIAQPQSSANITIGTAIPKPLSAFGEVKRESDHRVSNYLKLYQRPFSKAKTKNMFPLDVSAGPRGKRGVLITGRPKLTPYGQVFSSLGGKTFPSKLSSPVCKLSKTPTAFKANCSRRNLASIPQGLPTNITDLDLSFNRITYLSTNVFIRYPRLRSLDIRFNKISKLANRTFTGLRQLETLYISHNMLNFHTCSELCCNNPFAPLQNLKRLSVRKNVPERKPIALHMCLNVLHNLEQLWVSVTDNFVFGPEFRELKNLKHLDLSDSKKLTHLTEDFFTNLTKFPLRNLFFANCNLHTIAQGILPRLPKLEKLDLGKNMKLGLKNATRCLIGAHNSSLRVLRLNMLLDPALRTYIIVEEEDFEPLSVLSLTKLYMDWNNIVEIRRSALEKLPVSLEVFTLCHNKLSYPYNVLKPLLRLVNLRVLDAKSQSSSVAPHWVRLRNGRPYRNNEEIVGVARKVHPSGITYRDKAQKEKETSVLQRAEDVISVPPKLETVWLTGANPFHFRSPNVTFVNSSVKTLMLNRNKLGRFHFWISGLGKVETLDLSFNNLLIQVGFFDGFSGLRYLYLTGNYLDQPIVKDYDGHMFKKIVNLLVIDLEKNRISELHPNVFRNNNRLQRLSLPYNRLTSLGCRINHMRNLNLLDLKGNSLAYLDEYAITDLQAIAPHTRVRIDLTRNPLICSCDSLNFLKWTLSLPSNITLTNIEKMYCRAQNGSIYMSLSHRKEIVRDLEIRCGSNTSLIVCLSLSILTSILVVIGVVYRYRWKPRYSYHIHLLKIFIRRSA